MAQQSTVQVRDDSESKPEMKKQVGLIEMKKWTRFSMKSYNPSLTKVFYEE